MTESDPIYSDVPLVRDLLDGQAPVWAGLRLRPLPFESTDNALYKLGADKLVRLPKRQSARAPLEKELAWLPHLTGLPLDVPHLLLAGRPSAAFPHAFGVFAWIEGAPATSETIADPVEAAQSLGVFLAALRVIPTQGAPRAGAANHFRGVDLQQLDTRTRSAISTLSDEIDADAAMALWHSACALPVADAPCWLHGDLKADNLIVRGGRLVAVVDWGLAAVGDHAADIAAAWTWITPEARTTFRKASGADDVTWRRAQGWALYGAVIALSYYRALDGHAAICAQSRMTLHRLGLLQSGSDAV